MKKKGQMAQIIINGWSVRVRRKDKTTFVAHAGNVVGSAFFCGFREAHAFRRQLQEHGMTGFVVRASLRLDTE